jgi:hypothetical protein
MCTLAALKDELCGRGLTLEQAHWVGAGPNRDDMYKILVRSEGTGKQVGLQIEGIRHSAIATVLSAFGLSASALAL